MELLFFITFWQEVKQLTLDLLELAPETQKRKERSVTSFDWKPGELCKAMWADNGKLVYV